MTDTGKIFANQKKLRFFNEQINQGDVYLRLNATDPQVKVPASLGSDPLLNLKMSMAFNFQPEADETGVKATLKFSGEYFNCEIPWEAVWAITTEAGEQKLFQEDMPKEAAREMAKQMITQIGSKIFKKKSEKPKKEPEPAKKIQKKGKPFLKRVK